MKAKNEMKCQGVDVPLSAKYPQICQLEPAVPVQLPGGLVLRSHKVFGLSPRRPEYKTPRSHQGERAVVAGEELMKFIREPANVQRSAEDHSRTALERFHEAHGQYIAGEAGLAECDSDGLGNLRCRTTTRGVGDQDFVRH